MKEIFEQYEHKGWLITINNYKNTNQLFSFSVPTKFSHLLHEENYLDIDDIAEKNGFEEVLDEDGYFWIEGRMDDVMIFDYHPDLGGEGE